MLVRDYPVSRDISCRKYLGRLADIPVQKIAKNAITILINLSDDPEVLKNLATDDAFLGTLLTRVTVSHFRLPRGSSVVRTPTKYHPHQNPKEPNADEISMLLANLAKHDDLKKILISSGPSPPDLGSSNVAIDQLMDLFVKGAEGSYNPDANFDYLAYLFADIAKHEEGRKYFITKQKYDDVVPISKLVVFTEHKSTVRRKGVASTIKNVAFEIPSHPTFLSAEEINILPYLLLPITGNEEYAEEDMLDFIPDLQLLPPDKARDSDPAIIQTHVETLMLLTTTREGRDMLREVRVYPIIRETHLQIADEDVREACERLVQVLMRDEEGEEVSGDMKALDRGAQAQKSIEGSGSLRPGEWAAVEEVESDDDDKIVEV